MDNLYASLQPWAMDVWGNFLTIIGVNVVWSHYQCYIYSISLPVQERS